MKDNILVVSALFPPEPVVSASLSIDIVNTLASTNKVIVISPRPSRPFGIKFNSNNQKKSLYKHIVLDSYIFPASRLLGRLRESFSFGAKTSKYIVEHKDEIKVIYANTWPLFAQYYLIRSAKACGIPVVLHIHDIYPESLTEKLPRQISKFVYYLALPLDKYILRNANIIVGISPNMINYLRESRKLHKSRFELVRNWQNDEIFSKNYPKSDYSTLTYMYLGSISPSAGVQTLIKAFDYAKVNNSTLVIAGNGSDKENCIKLVEEIGNINISFCEVIPEEVAKLQTQADVLLLPLKKGVSLTATPSKLTAYMLSGKPIIACIEPESDAAEIIRTSKSGFISIPDDYISLGELMKKVTLMDKSTLNTMGINAKKFAFNHLSRGANLHKLVSVIKELYDKS